MAEGDALALLKAGCRALTDLVTDSEFKSDLAAAIQFAKAAEDKQDRALPEFSGFLDDFIRAEMEVLLQSGVNMDSTVKILNEISDLARDATGAPERLYRLEEKIRFCAKLACDSHKDLRQETPFWLDVRRAVTGVALIGIDLAAVGGTTIVFPPGSAAVAGAVVGVSIGYGGEAVRNAIRRFW
jgi:hypothetical protein